MYRSTALIAALAPLLAPALACEPAGLSSPTPSPDGSPAPGRSGDPGPDPFSPGPAISCVGAAADPHCSNPIDLVLIPELLELGVTPRDAGSAELCRRMTIDLAGRIPTPEELELCRRERPVETADRLLADERYLRTARRAFGERLAYDVSRSWYGHVVELDAIVGSHFEGELGYDALAARIAVHPGLYERNPGDEWASALFSLFLGRPARPDEIAGLRPLSFVFGSRLVCDGATLFNLEEEYGEPATECEEALEEVALNFCYCEPGDGSPGCRSAVLGAEVDFGSEGCRNEEDPDDEANLLRIGEAGLGMRSTCPDGQSGCRDRAAGEEDELLGPISALPKASGAAIERLSSLGAALAAREDFWEAAVDRELARLLGWWQSSFRRPDSDHPAIRRALAAELRRTNSLRDLHRTIVTSLLYSAPSASGVGAPPWAAGPTKLLSAESWLDSAGLATGELLGTCDFRFVTGEEYYAELLVDPSLFEEVESTLDEERFSEDDYYRAVRELGGCNADHPRPVISSLGMAYSERALAERLCAFGSSVLPSGFDPEDRDGAALAAAAQHLAVRAWSRTLSDGEVLALVSDMEACLSAGAGGAGAAPGTEPAGCDGPEEAVRRACSRMIDSAEFSLY